MVDILRNPTYEDLVNAIHNNWRSWWLTQRNVKGWEWFEESDATYFIRDNQAPMFNRVEKTSLNPATANPRVNEIKSVFTSRNTPFTWSINPGDEPDDLASRLEKAGLSRSETPSMAIEIKDLRMPRCPGGFTIEAPEGVKEVTGWSARGYCDDIPVGWRCRSLLHSHSS